MLPDAREHFRRLYSKLIDYLTTTFQTLDHYVLRWIFPVFTFLTAVLAFFLDISVDELKDRYPNWPGLLDQLEGLNLYFWLLTCASISAVGAIYNTIRSGSLRNRQRTINELNARVGAIAENIHEVMDNALRALCHKLEIDDGGTERVSLYIHNPDVKMFLPCGRFSYDPRLKQKGRTTLPDDKGCISLAWSNDWHFISNLPDPTTGRSYTDYMAANYNMPRPTTRSLRMKPRTIAAKRLSTDAGPVAVIVIESTKQARFLEADLRDKLNEVSPMYARLLVAFLPYIPDPQSARQVGL